MGTCPTLSCKDTFVANVTLNTKWQLNARFWFPTAIKYLDYEIVFERFRGIKYNKVRGRSRKWGGKGGEGPVEI